MDILIHLTAEGTTEVITPEKLASYLLIHLQCACMHKHTHL